MLTRERHNIIMELLKEMETVTLKDISNVVPASESTIRRDLTELENQGKLIRLHGGATLSEPKLQELTFTEKSFKKMKEKTTIAKYATSLAHEDDCTDLDTASTLIQMVPFLPKKDIVVVTNGPTHVDALTKYGITSYLIGGLTKTKNSAVVGQQAIATLGHFR